MFGLLYAALYAVSNYLHSPPRLIFSLQEEASQGPRQISKVQKACRKNRIYKVSGQCASSGTYTYVIEKVLDIYKYFFKLY